jgi:metallo-beta-lactamase family protein
MKITLFGAAGGEVTGSAYYIQTDRANVLLDFGMFQGMARAEEQNSLPPGLDVKKLDAVLLTHAHLDHTGRLPLLVKAGYTGPVRGTPATGELTNLILRDSAKVQAQDNERINRKRERAGSPPIEPMYSVAHVEQLMSLFQPVPYDEPIPVAPGIRACFAEAGHMLGSSSIQIAVDEGGRKKTIAFSGDLGPKGAPILRDFDPFHKAEVVFLESTYGDHDHKPFRATVDEFFVLVNEAVTHGGKILVPTFAVGRAQVLLLLLAGAFRDRKIPAFPVFLDSPMAIEASNIYQHHPELFDDELRAFMKERPLMLDLATLKATATADESKAINDVKGPCMVLAGAGMCNAGRILHHLKQNLWKPSTSVIIVGYQGRGTLGRLLVEGAEEVSIFGEKIAVKAGIHTLGGFSAHAGQTDLLTWFSSLAEARPRVYLTHGEDAARTVLARKILERFDLKAAMPGLREVIEI